MTINANHRNHPIYPNHPMHPIHQIQSASWVSDSGLYFLNSTAFRIKGAWAELKSHGSNCSSNLFKNSSVYFCDQARNPNWGWRVTPFCFEQSLALFLPNIRWYRFKDNRFIFPHYRIKHQVASRNKKHKYHRLSLWSKSQSLVRLFGQIEYVS